ncbi:hypothetical protein [Corynebacterium liangguodongii]|uniref:Uncharacterized protein n=1 Tax=Corynebacterium liangguodongii TaxID=2079535 RepID=A0A2S0WFU8_9CORY|nr:hypothetical protein [Corynebacterium liangguodongii]AWB84562.1 hypothetical protein C3E79_08750 [Corynebacterium liangguodongii]PWB98854.1 hypothetical protein DF219_09635 [Corynebacterium liangguodongii]
MERKSFNAALVLVVTAVAVYCLPEIVQMVRNGMFITRLSPALPEGILAADLPQGAVVFYVVALIVKYAALVSVAVFLTRAFVPMLRGRVFDSTIVSSLRWATYSIFVWYLGRIVLEGLANNYAAHLLGATSWWNTGSGTPLSDLSPALLLVAVLISLEAVIRKGAALEEEVDGLV